MELSTVRSASVGSSTRLSLRKSANAGDRERPPEGGLSRGGILWLVAGRQEGQRFLGELQRTSLVAWCQALGVLFFPDLLPGTPGPRGFPTRLRYRSHLALFRPNLRPFLRRLRSDSPCAMTFHLSTRWLLSHGVTSFSCWFSGKKGGGSLSTPPRGQRVLLPLTAGRELK